MLSYSRTRIGSYLESGGVRIYFSLRSSEKMLTCDMHLKVVFAQPRPGPSLPKGEHYLTIGWKQVCLTYSLFRELCLILFYVRSGKRSSPIKSFPILSYICSHSSSLRMCVSSFISPFMFLLTALRYRASTLQALSYLFVRTTSFPFRS